MDAADVLADDVEVRRERLVALATELVAAAALAGEDGHPVARFEPRDTVADLVDNTRGVTARNVRHLEVDAGEPAPRPDVEVVERRRLHVDEDLVGVDLRLREVAVFEDASVTVTVELDGLHRHHCPRLGYHHQPPGRSDVLLLWRYSACAYIAL